MGVACLTGHKFYNIMNYIGNLLVAPPAQTDSFWSKSVIYIYEQNQNFVTGLVLNKPSDRTVGHLAEHHDLEYNGSDFINIGGPVNANALVMLHTDDWVCSNTMHVNNNLRISSDKTMLTRICSHDTPKKWKMFLGMSSWTTNQLEGEMKGVPPWNKKLSWLVAPASNSIIFEPNATKLWKKSIDVAVQEMTDSYFTIN
jgi:putative transcriptional regulator